MLEKQLERNLNAFHRLDTQNPETGMKDIWNSTAELANLYQEK